MGWHVTHDMWHVTRYKWHATCCGGWTFSKKFTFLALTVCDLWYHEDLEEKADGLTDWMNEAINYEAVCRKGPTTPGPFKSAESGLHNISLTECIWSSYEVLQKSKKI